MLRDYEIVLAERAYPLRLRKLAQAKSISVSVDTVKQEVRLTMPKYASEAQALRFAQSKSDWLIQRLAEALPPVALVSGAEIAYCGEPYIIRWLEHYARKPVIAQDEIHVGGPQDRVADRLLNWLKSEARAQYTGDLAYYCERAETSIPELSVGDARRRWGSCSGRKAIRLNWRLIMAPTMVRRSVVAHEVAHLRHMDHSPRFYSHLDEIFEGDRKAADRWLKEHGSALHLIGA